MDHHPRLDAQSQGKGRRVRKLSAGDNQLAEMWRPDKSLYQPRGDDTAADKRSAVGICVGVRGSRVGDVVIDIGGSQKAMLTASMLVAHLEFVPSRQREAGPSGGQWGLSLR